MNDTTQHEFEDRDGTEHDAAAERAGTFSNDETTETEETVEREATAERGTGADAKTDGEEQVVDEPVLDGATDHQDTDVDPRKGLTDPALIRDIDAEKKTVNPYG